jgi:hypothetical protein
MAHGLWNSCLRIIFVYNYLALTLISTWVAGMADEPGLKFGVAISENILKLCQLFSSILFYSPTRCQCVRMTKCPQEGDVSSARQWVGGTIRLCRPLSIIRWCSKNRLRWNIFCFRINQFLNINITDILQQLIMISPLWLGYQLNLKDPTITMYNLGGDFIADYCW